MSTAPHPLDTKIAGPFRGMFPGGRDKDDIQPRTNFNTGEVKLSPREKQTYSSGVVVLRGDGSGQDRNVTIAVEQYEPFPIGTIVETSGPTWITPYVNNGRVALSVICEKLVEVKDTAKDNAEPETNLPTLGGDKK